MNDTLRNGVLRFVLEAGQGFRAVRRTAYLMCGVGDYDTYLAHQRKFHPGQPVLDYTAFIRAQQDARYSRGMARCC